MEHEEYLFRSKRLGFRNWDPTDLDDFTLLNQDPEVMRHFPSSLTREDTKTLMERLQRQFIEKGYTYFATELLQTGEFIGFIGLSWQDYRAPFTPATDIGWRLRRVSWGQGYATEGAQRCLKYGFETLGLDRVVSVCPVTNNASEQVMKKAGMKKQGTFKHPGLTGHPSLEKCVWYEIDAPEKREKR